MRSKKMPRDIKKMLKLALIMLKGASYSRGKKETGLKKNKNKALYILLPICFLPTLISMVSMIVMGYSELNAVGDATLIIKSYLTISAMLTLMLGFSYAVSILFFSTDSDLLAHLPIKSWQICGARFTVVLFYEYLFEGFVFIPMFITYGIMSGASVMFYIYSIIVGIMLPILPVALLSVLTMLLVRFIPFFKSKENMNYFTTILSIVIILALYIPFMNTMNTENESVAAMFYSIAGPGSAADTLQYVLPTLTFAFNALSKHCELAGIIDILLFAFGNALGFVLFMLVAKLLYTDALQSVTEGAKSRKKLTSKEVSQRSVKSSAIKALTLKELRFLMRSPTYFMNCVISVVIFPIIFGIAFFFGAESEDMLGEIQSFFQSGIDEFIPIALIILSVITAFIGGTGSIASTAVSREGTQISFSKMIPVPYFTQLKAKLYSAIILSAAPFALLILAACLVIGVGIQNSVFFTITAFMAFTVTSEIGLLVDMGRPKLIWDNEQVAVKQNINGFLGMILAIPVVIIISLPSVLAFFLLHFNAFEVCITNIAFSILTYRLLLVWIYKRADKCYDNIQI